MPWTFDDNMYYDSRSGKVYLHTPEEDFFYLLKESPIGVGGMGYVLKGYSLRNGSLVAIKRVHDKYSSLPDVRNRARSEARLAFRHNNLIEMKGIVESKTGKGPIFIISNFINGVTINKFIETHFHSFKGEEYERRIINMMLPILDALKYIHYYNISHLDIKPSNIMVENGRNVRLMDLGIALPKNIMNLKSFISGSGESLSGTGLMGTPKYAAPEQFGLPGYGEISCRSDIYEFGVTLYELLTGHNPYEAINLKESMSKHQEVILPQDKAVSSKVLKILRKATSFYPKDRYENVDLMKDELLEVINLKSQKGGLRGFIHKIGF